MDTLDTETSILYSDQPVKEAVIKDMDIITHLEITGHSTKITMGQ